MKKKISKSLLMTALITGMCIGGVQSAFAAENLQEFTLDPMIVTATRTEKNLLKVPASASVITKEDIQDRNATSVKEALKGQSGLYVDTSMYPAGGIQLRGFSAENILVLYDGQPMNHAWGGEVNWDAIPIEQVERIEIVRGAASSLYGGRAVGGVINIISKEMVEKKVAGSAVVTYGSNNTWKKSIDVQGKINDRWDFTVGYLNKETDGHDGKRKYKQSASSAPSTVNGVVTAPQLSGNNKKYPGYYVIGGYGDREVESENINLSFKYKFDEDKSLKYSFTHSEYEYDYNNPFSFVKDSNGKAVFNGGYQIKGTNKYLNLSYKDYVTNPGEIETNIHVLNYTDKKNLWNISMGVQDVKKSGYSSAGTIGYFGDEGSGTYAAYPSKNYNVDIQKTWEDIGKHTITVGGNWKDETMERVTYNLSNWKDFDSITGVKEFVAAGSAETFSVFVQDEYKFDDKYTMYLGGRYDHFRKYDGFSRGNELGSGTYNEFSPKVSFEYSPDDNSSWYASYGHSFNPPTLYQVYRETAKIQANPDLEPETTDTYEIGYKKKFDKTMLGVALFYAETDNALNSDGVGTVPNEEDSSKLKTMYINADEGKRKGIEFELKHKFDEKLEAYLNYTWQDGELTTDGETENRYEIPKHLLHFGLDYNVGKLNAILDGQYVSERQAPEVATGEFYSEDAFFIMNAYFNYKLTPQTTLQFGIENIFDKDYYVQEAAQGRTYYAGLRYSF